MHHHTYRVGLVNARQTSIEVQAPSARDAIDVARISCPEATATTFTHRVRTVSPCCGQSVSRAVPGEGEWSCDNCHQPVRL